MKLDNNSTEGSQERSNRYSSEEDEDLSVVTPEANNMRYTPTSKVEKMKLDKQRNKFKDWFDYEYSQYKDQFIFRFTDKSSKIFTEYEF